jgi:serine phosphatase RsbU (regulator of sigma subunit)
MTEAPPADAGQKKTLLVVDDAPANIQVVQSILKDEYKIRVATSGEKALELVKSQPHPDLILLDVVMPGLDGYEVCEQLKADPETRDIPVIFLTGLTDVDDETKGLQIGAVDYIRKPFTPAIVKARVRTQLLIRDARDQVNRQVQAVNQELEMARHIQLSILPGRPPSVPGLGVAARYLPMTTIAGDYYDYLPVDEQHLGILVADVSGHGAPSALITSMLKIVLAEQSGHASDPARVLGGMNAALCGKFDRHFVTAAYIFLDLDKGVLRYGGAGHPPLSIWRAEDGRSRAIEENGLLLAQFPEETYSFVELPLRPGDRLVLNTDGVSECPNPNGEEFGTVRLLAFLDQNRELPVEEFADAVIGAICQWSMQPQGENQHDDITLLAIDFGQA